MINIYGLLRRSNLLTNPFALTIILVVLLYSLTLSMSKVEASPSTTKNVLIISSYSPDFPFYTSFVDGIKKRLAEESTTEFQIYYESLDLLRFKLDNNFYKNLADVLRQKHATNAPDIIITHGDFASAFISQYGSYIFGNTPAILTAYAYEHEKSKYQSLPANYTILAPKSTITNNVRLIQDLRPNTKKIYVVIGASNAEKSIRTLASQELASFAEHAEIIYLDKLALPDMLKYIGKIESDSVILFRMFHQDVRGNSYIPAEVVKNICAVSPVPVFVSTEIHLGKGALGGYMDNNHFLARQATEKALNSLNGTKVKGNQVELLDIANYVFDWRQLQRWHIDESKLPPENIIKYTPFCFWDSYKWYIVSGICIIILQFALIMLLVVNMRKRKQAENGLDRLDRLNLVGEMAAGIGHEVRNPMTTVRGYLQLFQRREKFAEYRNQLDTMIEELDRANDIITEFLSLAKNKLIELKPGNLNDILHELFPLMQASAFSLGHKIQVDVGDIPKICFDDKEIRQLILNLVRNGLQAMNSSGILTIKTYLKDGEIILAIQDTGTGIPKEVLDKIGTPFVTTKEGGTGLGLSVCYRIAERHKANINIITSSKGTTFLVNFRAVENF